MRQLLLLLLPLTALSTAPDCPPGFDDGGDGSCYSRSLYNKNRNDAYDYCADYHGYIYDVSNAFQNSGIQNRVGQTPKIWLGLTCLDNSVQSCAWDYGASLTSTSYTNFYRGTPNATAGPCVYMDVTSGYWYNADCGQVNITFGCKYTPGRDVPRCVSYSLNGIVTFRNKCYFPTYSYGFDDAVRICNDNCGQVASIHSPGENQFVNSLGFSYSGYGSYIYTGLQYGRGYYTEDISNNVTPTSGSLSYHWNDSSYVDYTNFGYENVQLGQCVAMALKDDLIKVGQWINTDCGGTLTAVCKRDVVTDCDQPTTVPPTLAPQDCTSPYFYSGSGTIYSPGYPAYSSHSNLCEYLITEDAGQTASVHFRELQLNYYSNITFYSGITDTVPFKTIPYGYYDSQDVSSPTNIIRMYYSTPGDSSSWIADYGIGWISSSSPATTTATVVPQECPPSPFYSGSGTIYSPGYPGYGNQNITCEYLITEDAGRTAVIHFMELQLNYYSKITFYSGISDSYPFQTITYNNYWYSQDVYSPTNIIRMYYTSPGDSSRWVADYGFGTVGTTPDYWRTTRSYGQQTTVNWNPWWTTRSYTEPSTTTRDPWNTVAPSGECGNVYYYSGTINSPNFPNNYPLVTQNCTYYLNAMSTVTCLVFDVFDVRYYDYVILYDGQDSYNIEIATFTGSDQASGVYCSRYYRSMTVVLQTYNYNYGYVQGFKARFAASAQQLESSTTAAYPTYPTAYPTAYPYTWKAK